jgi:diguanylate cyclase (GGDEF)-like protein
MGTIILNDPANQVLRVRATYGYRDTRVQSITFAQDQGYSAKAMRENRPLLILDASREPQLARADEIEELRSVASAIVAPLAPKGPLAVPHGVISLDATHRAAFSEADLRILVAFANTAAVAIDNAQLHAEVQRLAVTDSLTGLANPRAFEHALAVEAYRAARYGTPLSLVIMDIDGFKKYNDTFGHLAGNDRLKAIAGILRAEVRDPDLPVRYGGEEFALLLPHTQKAGALILAERIRELAETGAPAAGAPTSGYTLSLGVATLPTDALTAHELLLAADNAELAAKRAGKNRVCAAEPLMPGS